MKRILLSLAVLIIVSTTVGFIFWNKTVEGFVKFFLLATVAQLIIQFVVNQFLNAKYGVQISQLAAAAAAEAERTVKEIACPCYIRNVQSVNVDLQRENKYTCERCAKEISLVVELTPALTTKPVDGLKAEVITVPAPPNE